VFVADVYRLLTSSLIEEQAPIQFFLPDDRCISVNSYEPGLYYALRLLSKPFTIIPLSLRYRTAIKPIRYSRVYD
jgi:hypothetical protein